MELSNLVKVYKGAFDKEHCRQLIDIYESDAAKRFETDVMKFDQCTLKNDNLPTMNAVQIFLSYFNQYDRWLKSKNQNYLPPIQELEQLRIKKYPIDGYFKEHIDAADRQSSRRFLSAFVYLNDSGGTKFFNRRINAEAGTMVIFPPQWMFPHTGLVGNKEKYFLSTYCHFSA
tara:strand:+ start:2007 stop:2525 length:519 start_codon:yes stop_codon:yes gene_type:complete